jgi:hypothetical protein
LKLEDKSSKFLLKVHTQFSLDAVLYLRRMEFYVLFNSEKSSTVVISSNPQRKERRFLSEFALL